MKSYTVCNLDRSCNHRSVVDVVFVDRVSSASACWRARFSLTLWRAGPRSARRACSTFWWRAAARHSARCANSCSYCARGGGRASAYRTSCRTDCYKRRTDARTRCIGDDGLLSSERNPGRLIGGKLPGQWFDDVFACSCRCWYSLFDFVIGSFHIMYGCFCDWFRLWFHDIMYLEWFNRELFWFHYIIILRCRNSFLIDLPGYFAKHFIFTPAVITTQIENRRYMDVGVVCV